MARAPAPVDVGGCADGEEDRETKARSPQEPTATAVVSNGVDAREEENAPDRNRTRTDEGGPLLRPRVVADERFSMGSAEANDFAADRLRARAAEFPIIRMAGYPMTTISAKPIAAVRPSPSLTTAARTAPALRATQPTRAITRLAPASIGISVTPHARKNKPSGAIAPGRSLSYPNATRYGCQPSGIFGAESVTKRAGAGGRGGESRFMRASASRRFPFFRLHGAQEVTTFSQTESPPRLRGTTWSSVSFPADPQYWQRHPSRAKSARREIFRFTARGTRT
jgi:hypothetical protein